jgi:pyrroloquinoline quinone biosynthesis protein E
MTNTDPVCSKSPKHDVIQQAIDSAKACSELANEKPLIFRNNKNSKLLS